MGVVLGLGAALSWGLADYFAALASRGIGALRVVLGFHLFALIPLTVLVLATDGLAKVTAHELVFYVAVGAVGWVSYLAFYGALAIGPISVLSPIVSGYAAVTVLLAVLFAGNPCRACRRWRSGSRSSARCSHRRTCARSSTPSCSDGRLLGFVLALCAMALLGGFVFGVSYYRPQIGWLGPIFLARAFATVFVLAHVLAGGRAEPPAAGAQEMPEIDAVTAGAGPLAAGAVSVPDARGERRWRTLLGLLMILALLDTGGYVFFNIGVGHAPAAIVAAASAPYAVVPIIMGVSLFKERPTGAQWVGVGCVIVGVIVLGAVS